MSRGLRNTLLLCLLLLPAGSAFAKEGFDVLNVTQGADGNQTWSVTIQVLALMTALTFLPAALMMMTSFTRIVVVLAILRQALGTMNTPSNQVLIGLSLFLTLFIMWPVFEQVNSRAIQPYLEDKITLQAGMQQAEQPLRDFMMRQTREDDLAMFARIAGREDIAKPEDVPFTLLVPAFVTSELKTAFQIGFLLFIPFLIIDLVVASVLMSMGMMMLSPMIVSLPFKLMLFVLVDGWALIIGTLASSFYV